MKLEKASKQYSLNFEASVNYFSELVLFDAGFYKKNKQKNTLLIGLDEVGRGCIAGPVAAAAYSCFDFYAGAKDLIRYVKFGEELLDDQLYSLLLLDDSKRVPHAKRDQLCNVLLDLPSLQDGTHIFHSISFEAAENIDQKGIVNCIWDAMVSSLLDVLHQYHNFYNETPKEILLLVDGNKTISNLVSRLNACDSNLENFKFLEVDFDPKQTRLELELNQDQVITIKQVSVIKGDSQSASIAAASNLAKNARDKHMETICENKYNWFNNSGYGTREHYKAIEKHGLSAEHRKSFLSCLEEPSLS